MQCITISAAASPSVQLQIVVLVVSECQNTHECTYKVGIATIDRAERAHTKPEELPSDLTVRITHATPHYSACTQ